MSVHYPWYPYWRDPAWDDHWTDEERDILGGIQRQHWLRVTTDILRNKWGWSEYAIAYLEYDAWQLGVPPGVLVILEHIKECREYRRALEAGVTKH